MSTSTTTSKPRTTCPDPDCGREVSFWTDLVHKFLTRHRRPDGLWCMVRQSEFPPLKEAP